MTPEEKEQLEDQIEKLHGQINDMQSAIRRSEETQVLPYILAHGKFVLHNFNTIIIELGQDERNELFKLAGWSFDHERIFLDDHDSLSYDDGELTLKLYGSRSAGGTPKGQEQVSQYMIEFCKKHGIKNVDVGDAIKEREKEITIKQAAVELLKKTEKELNGYTFTDT